MSEKNNQVVTNSAKTREYQAKQKLNANQFQSRQLPLEKEMELLKLRLESDKLRAERTKSVRAEKLEQEKLALEREKFVRQTENENKTNRRESWKIRLDYLKFILWPLFVAVILFFYWEQLNNIFEVILERLPEVSSLTVGPLQAQWNELAKEDPMLASTLQGLSPQALEELVDIPSSQWKDLVAPSLQNGTVVEYRIYSDDRLDALAELEAQGLITFRPDSYDSLAFRTYFKSDFWIPSSRVSEDTQGYIPAILLSDEIQTTVDDFRYRLTDEGEIAKQAIVTAVLNILEESSEQE